MAEADVDLEDDLIVVYTDYSEKDLIRAVPGSRWNPEHTNGRSAWTVPLSWGSCNILRGLFGPRLQLSDNLRAWAWNERQRRIEPANEIRMATQWAGGVITEAGLYPFQDVGVEFLVRAEQALLADDMGTGKTLQIIRALRRLESKGRDAFPVCVVCPNTVKRTWAIEWAKWDPAVKTFVIQGGAVARRKIFAAAEDAIASHHDVAIIINKEGVRGHSKMAPYGNIRLTDDQKKSKELNDIKFRSVIVDEAHCMKDPKAQQTRAIWALQHGPSVTFRYALTGTPVANHVGDLWSIMHGISPQDYPTKTKWIDRYCLMSWNAFGGLDIIGVRPDTRDEFYKVLNPRMRRMPKSLVLPFLPPKTREVRYVDMGSKQAKAYRDLEESMVTRLDDGSFMLTSNDLVRAIRLLQFSSSYATIDGSGDVHMAEPSPKLDAMEEIIEELDGQPVVIVAQSRQLVEMAAARLEARQVTHRLIVGGVPESVRQQNIEDFQAGRVQVMLMTIAAGGVGITLTRAACIVFLQRSWSMIDNKQCEDRVHRIGSEVHDNVVVIDMIATNTIEESQIPHLHAKLLRLEEIVRDREILAAHGDTAGLAQLDAEESMIEQQPLWVMEKESVA